MKITGIKQQVRRKSSYSIYVDDNYCLSISEALLLESKLYPGQTLDESQLATLKKLADEDKLYVKALRYVALRLRSKWEIISYLEKKSASPALIDTIVNKLSKIGIIDDEKFAQTFVSDRRLLRPASRRKMIYELRKKHIAGDIIEKVLGDDKKTETDALRSIIKSKRRQAKYHDELKLKQYLARQGFNYDDIKGALHRDN